MKMNKGDVILLCILFATLCFFAINEFNILAGVDQYDSSFVTLFGAIFGGELLSFAIYKIGMAKYEGKKEAELAKYDALGSAVVDEIIGDIEEIEDLQKRGKHTNE